MGNWAKNRAAQSGSTAIRIPYGNAADRPGMPVFSQFRYNIDIAGLEFYDGTQWCPVAQGNSIQYTVDSFVGDGSTTIFTMSQPESAPQQIMVFVGSVYQIPTTNYTVDSGYDITFNSAPPNDLPVNVIHSTT